ncbi:MAG: hypothetical protein CME62_13460 [Halobacteriovoraceae bacterium]|nr:hypothetical protein [Halobacteriovoraceae bacterium]|tara:strand:+ start:6322 stop:6747 length:426 start_codon:yes stop_codon:yes gene_type:complete
MIEALLLTFFFIFCAIALHYYCLKIFSRFMPKATTSHHHDLRSLSILLGLFLLHMIEILFFTLLVYVITQIFHLGDFTDKFTPIFRDYFYYTTVSYTTLGLSDFSPLGHLKVVTGLISLAGFMLLTWSASFYFKLTNHNVD